MRIPLSLIGALLLTPSAAAALAPAATAEADMAAPVDRVTALRLERQLGLVGLPAGASPLDQYARYYFRNPDTDPRLVSAIYIGDPGAEVPNWPAPGLYLRRPPVVIFDGGCMVVWITYDPFADRIVSIHCNGYA
jgi:hypothetical protein